MSVRLPENLIQRLDRYLDWGATHRLKSTRNAAMREALSAWLDQQERRAGLLEPEALRRQFQATDTSLSHPPDGVPIYRLRQLLQWPRECFDAILEALRAEQHVDLETLTEHAVDDQAIQDSYHVHGQCYVRLTWRA